MAQTPVRSRSEQAAHTRQQVLDTAIELFAERGYDATSLQMIADRMGVTKAAVYYHFRAKADILLAISMPVMAAMEALMDDVATRRTRADRIRGLVEGFVDVLLTKRDVITIFASDPALRHDKHVDANRYDGLVEQAVEVLYGPDATPDERAAIYLASGLTEIIPALADLPDDELRAVLVRLASRLLRVPARPVRHA